MNCPPEIASILLQVLSQGLLQARAAGWAGNAVIAAVEGDHVHNLPSVIADYSPARLQYYWGVERLAYLEIAMKGSTSLFDPLWDQLRPHVEKLIPMTAAG